METGIMMELLFDDKIMSLIEELFFDENEMEVLNLVRVML
jgi:hypothetical protein